MPGIKQFHDRVVVITGAGSGIGAATARAFAHRGARLVLADLSAERLAEVAAGLPGPADRVATQVVDVALRDQLLGLADLALERFGRVDIMHANAGVAVSKPFAETSLDDWEWITQTNYWGVIYALKAFLPHLIAQRQGHLVITSSVMGLCATPTTSAYCATKHALVGLGEALRGELREHNVGVSVICPGVIQTRVIEGARIAIRPEAKIDRDWISNLYRQRGWPPERVAEAVLRAVARDRAVVPVGPESWLAWWLYRFSPGLFRGATGWLYRRWM